MSTVASVRESSASLDALPENGTPGPSGIHENGQPLTVNGTHDPDDFPLTEGDVSPTSLRRSTRQANLKAQQKIIMGILPSGIEEGHPDMENQHDTDEMSEPKTKKLKLMDGLEMDQYSCKFGVRMDKDDVYMLSDESEIASLNSEEVGELRRNYEEFKQAGVSSEQQFERDIQVKELEAELRSEENKLILLKKTVQNQKEAELEQLKKQKIIADAMARQQQMQMNSFKPVVATNPAKVNGTTPKSSKSKQNNAARDTSQAILSLDPAAQRELLNRLMSNPQLAGQANNLLPPQLLQALRQQQQQNIQKAASTPTPPVPPPKKETVPTITPAQKAADARRKLKQSLDQQLLSIPTPKPIVSDINFIPNSTPDFLYLLGLDLTVQRVLKDKNVFKKYDDEPYSCEECGTDFTPAWKAIVGKENDLHLYCEKCVREAQKKKMRQDHGALYKKAFAKVVEQEKELEKQIAAGKFDDPAPPPPPPPKAATPTLAKQSTSSSTLHQSASAGNLNPVAAALLLQQQQQQQQRQKQQAAQQASTSTQANKTQSQSKGTKRQASNATSTSANAASNNATQNMFMNLLRSNPLMAAAMMGSNPQMLQWLGNANNASANRSSSNANNNVGALALLQMAAAANNPSAANTNNQNLLNLFNNPLAALMAQNPLLQNLQRLQQQQASSSSSKSKK